MVYRLLSLLSLLPLPVLYVLADWVVYPLMRHVVRYRRRVVEKNLGLAFPEKSDAERLRIERAFYHHLCDVLVETLHLRRMSREELCRRFQWDDADLVRQSADGRRLTLCYMAHYANWEWFLARLFPTAQCGSVAIYSPLHNASVNRWLLDSRSRFGLQMVDMRHVSDQLSELLAVDNRRYAVIALSDQLPKEQYVRHFHRLLGIKTKVLTGTEQLIRHFDMQVCYCYVTQTRRGYYTCHVEPLPTPATADSQQDRTAVQPGQTTDWPCTDAYIDLLSRQIAEAPHLWLWSHDRWRR